MGFACLDDSMVYEKGFYVYSHAIAAPDISPDVLVFEGDKHSIYQHESKLIDFIKEYLPDDFNLYACEHYIRYARLWTEIVHERAFADGRCMERRDRKIFKRVFNYAHSLAKMNAKSRILESLKAL